jgi:hypothetical protein
MGGFCPGGLAALPKRTHNDDSVGESFALAVPVEARAACLRPA